jgi:hypothetical protein
MKTISAREIVLKWLLENGYDGLAGEECGCSVYDFAPCGCIDLNECVAGHRVRVKTGDFVTKPGKRRGKSPTPPRR